MSAAGSAKPNINNLASLNKAPSTHIKFSKNKSSVRNKTEHLKKIRKRYLLTWFRDATFGGEGTVTEAISK